MKTSISLSSSVRAGLRSLYRDKPVRVKFVNLSGREVQLYWINYIGECEKAFKITDGKLLYVFLVEKLSCNGLIILVNVRKLLKLLTVSYFMSFW